MLVRLKYIATPCCEDMLDQIEDGVIYFPSNGAVCCRTKKGIAIYDFCPFCGEKIEWGGNERKAKP